MKILFDQGTPVPLRRYLSEHTVTTAAEMNWSLLENGELLAAAENSGIEILVTTDQNLRYQQNLSHRKIGIVVLKTTSWPKIERNINGVVKTITAMTSGGYDEVAF